MIFTGQASDSKVLRTLNFFDTDRRTDGSQSFGYGPGFKAIEFVYIFIDQGASYHHRSRTSCAFWTIPSNHNSEHVDSPNVYAALQSCRTSGVVIGSAVPLYKPPLLDLKTCDWHRLRNPVPIPVRRHCTSRRHRRYPCRSKPQIDTVRTRDKYVSP